MRYKWESDYPTSYLFQVGTEQRTVRSFSPSQEADSVIPGNQSQRSGRTDPWQCSADRTRQWPHMDTANAVARGTRAEGPGPMLCNKE